MLTNEALLAAIEARENSYQTQEPKGFVALLPRKRLQIDASTRTALFAFATEQWMRNPANMLHGGVLASFFDNAMGILTHGFLAENESAVTAELQLSYLHGVAIGETVYIAVTVESLGSRLVRLHAEAYTDENLTRLAATAHACYCRV